LSSEFKKLEQLDTANQPLFTNNFNKKIDFSENEKPKIFKLDPNTPKFHGNSNEDVEDWLCKVKINLDIAQIPSDKYYDYLTNYCVGKAGVFMRRLRESSDHKY
jgi:hypothetical protein